MLTYFKGVINPLGESRMHSNIFTVYGENEYMSVSGTSSTWI